MARRTKTESEATRQNLLDAAEVLFSEKGVSNTSLADIAAAAGVTRGAIYWHFKNKVDLFEAMHARVRLSVDEIESEVLSASDPITGMHAYWSKSLLRIAHDPQRRRVIDILFRKCEYVDEYHDASIRISDWSGEIVEAMTHLYAKAETENLLAPELTPYGAARATFSMVTGIVFTWMAAPKFYGSDDDVLETVHLFFRAVRR